MLQTTVSSRSARAHVQPPQAEESIVKASPPPTRFERAMSHRMIVPACAVILLCCYVIPGVWWVVIASGAIIVAVCSMACADRVRDVEAPNGLDFISPPPAHPDGGRLTPPCGRQASGGEWRRRGAHAPRARSATERVGQAERGGGRVDVARIALQGPLPQGVLTIWYSMRRLRRRPSGVSLLATGSALP